MLERNYILKYSCKLYAKLYIFYPIYLWWREPFSVYLLRSGVNVFNHGSASCPRFPTIFLREQYWKLLRIGSGWALYIYKVHTSINIPLLFLKIIFLRLRWTLKVAKQWRRGKSLWSWKQWRWKYVLKL